MSNQSSHLASASRWKAWSQRSLYGSISSTRVFLRKQLWVWPILAIVVLSTVGLFVRSAVESTMRANLQSDLETIRNVEVAMLKNWYQTQESNARSLANLVEVRHILAELENTPDALTEEQTGEVQRYPELNSNLEQSLAAGLQHHQYLGFVALDEQHRVLGSSNSELLGQTIRPAYDDMLRRVFRGECVVTPPFKSEVPMLDRAGRLRTGVPTMFACAPVRDEQLRVVAALAFRMDPEGKFSEMLQLGRQGETGETYAFDREGYFISRSRFEDELALLGLIPDQAESTSILTLQNRDPLGDLQNGYRPRIRRAELPFTLMATSALDGQTAVNIDGYRDYRGTLVVGAWDWLPDYQVGVVTEIDLAEAYQPLYILRRTVWTMYTLLALSAVAIFVFTILVSRANRRAQTATIEARQLGQYHLEEKLGSGAMGVVYRGQHAMLRRPTAIKLLSVERTNPESIQRFEREVQLTCQLNHPNTVMIYDFGRTPEGVFYYAMEYLDGLDLQNLVDRYGPLPEARVLWILHQICGSLFEAHLTGLVHRDIKPANIMLNRRGGEADVVKVLDFGLARAVDQRKSAGLTQANSLTGTPLYLSPEGIQTPDLVDARSDIYAVGAVGYFLLTGRPVFESHSLVELCQQHLTASPESLSHMTGVQCTPELDDLLLACLEKTPGRRPQTARELAQRLEACPAWGEWTLEHSEVWWQRHDRQKRTNTFSSTKTDSGSTSLEQTRLGSLDELETPDE